MGDVNNYMASYVIYDKKYGRDLVEVSRPDRKSYYRLSSKAAEYF